MQIWKNRGNLRCLEGEKCKHCKGNNREHSKDHGVVLRIEVVWRRAGRRRERESRRETCSSSLSKILFREESAGEGNKNEEVITVLITLVFLSLNYISTMIICNSETGQE